MTCVAVACSGGRDSVALLHAVATAARDVPGLGVVALHVHHGLNAQADAWLSHVERLCHDWSAQGLPVRCVSKRVHVPRGPGLSVEAEARRVRRSALADLAREVGAELILLAHHRRDQAETLLLQALRGGGLAGLAAMPRQQDQGGLRWIRPWLNHPREAIEAYVAHHGLEHVDDDSNGDPRFARNRLRLQVWPALLAAFPDAEVGLAHAAAHLGDALEPLADWQGRAVAALGSELDVVEWAAWSDSARRESLRHWYRTLSIEAFAPIGATRVDGGRQLSRARCRPRPTSGQCPTPERACTSGTSLARRVTHEAPRVAPLTVRYQWRRDSRRAESDQPIHSTTSNCSPKAATALPCQSARGSRASPR